MGIEKYYSGSIGKKINKMVRTERLYTKEYVFSNFLNKNNRNKIDVDGYNVTPYSLRYEVFNKSCGCCVCGIDGLYFALEKNRSEKGNSYHFNLYGIDKNGKEVLMTKDHIIPKSCGGSNTLDNFQTMCTNCNEKKGTNDDIEFKKKYIKN